MSATIIPMILQRIADRLTVVCQTIIDPNDPTYVNIIKLGRWQQDPVTPINHINILGGDPEDEKLSDGIVSLHEKEFNIHFYVPPREIGENTEAWWRRGCVQFGGFYISDALEEDAARQAAYQIAARIENTIPVTTVYDLIDDTDNERAIKLFIVSTTMLQAGGPPNSFVYHGKVMWQCLTERTSR